MHLNELSRDELIALVKRLGNALENQDERWGLYGNESQQALKAFKAVARAEKVQE